MKTVIFRKSFNALMVTQFLGACNDNILKQLIVLQLVGGVWAGKFGEGGQGIVTMIFTLPFLLFSGISGQLADRYSKQKLTVCVKTTELVFGLVALVSLWAQSLWGATLTLLFLALQSTVFGPAKYGMVPELLEEAYLSRGNGVMNMLTNLAVISGCLIGGTLSEYYPERNILSGMVVLVIAVAGFFSSLFLSPLPARDPSVRLSINPFAPYISSLRMMFRRRGLMAIALGWAFFDFIAVMILQSVVDFKALLNLSDRETSMMNLPLMVGVALGSVTAGYCSKNRIMPGLIPIGSLGLSGFMALLGLTTLTPTLVVAYLTGVGFFGGLYLIPLQALIQSRAPADLRGRVLGTTNFLGFASIALAGLVYSMLSSRAHLTVQAQLFLCSITTLTVSGWLFWQMRFYLLKRFRNMTEGM